MVDNMIKRVAKGIPTSGTFASDATTGGKKEIEVNVIDGGGRTLMPGMIAQPSPTGWAVA